MTATEYATRIEPLQGRLYRMAYLYLHNEHGALEAVDEAVYQGLRSAKKLRQPEFFDTWLTRIVINTCKKELRRSKRVQPMDILPEEAIEAYDALPLKEAIRCLPPELKDIIILRYYADFTLVQTAEMLAIPQGTAATRQRRALALLKLELTEEV